MTKLLLPTAFFLLTCFAQAQSVPDFEEMNRKEIRHFLLNQETSELAKTYARKHKRTRNVANGFLIGSGTIALSGVVYHFAHSYEEGTFEEFAHAIGYVGFAWGTGLTLATSGILHLISTHHLQKAKNFYLTAQPSGNTTSLGVGVRIRF